MQLGAETKHKSIRARLATAAVAVVGTIAPANATEISTAVLHYTEPDRVTVDELNVQMRRFLRDDRVFTLGLQVDIMTGATPIGAQRSTQAQTFTRPSGRADYEVSAGKTPLERVFQDNRASLTVDYESPWGRRNTVGVGSNVSIEYDYLSLGANGRFARDFNKRNTTVSAAAAFAYDRINPEGGVPVEWAEMQPLGQPAPRQSVTENKMVGDAVFGVTQVLDRKTIVRCNYSASRASGYQNDPYKLVSVVQAPGDATPGLPLTARYERRRNTRLKQSVYGLVKRALGSHVVELSYRFLWDDWGVNSHTAEAKFDWELGGDQYVQPAVRWYAQSAADDFVYFVVDGQPLPRFASADVRLGQFNAPSVMIKYGKRLADGREVNVRLGYYRQMGDSSPPEAFGVMATQDLFPTLDAFILQLGYNFSR